MQKGQGVRVGDHFKDVAAANTRHALEHAAVLVDGGVNNTWAGLGWMHQNIHPPTVMAFGRSPTPDGDATHNPIECGQVPDGTSQPKQYRQHFRHAPTMHADTSRVEKPASFGWT